MKDHRSPEQKLLDAIFGTWNDKPLKVKVNTVGSHSLCDTCQHSTIMQGDNMQDRLIYCSSPYPAVRIPFEVRRCSDYRTYEDVSVGEMKEIAWTLRTDSGGRKIGFKPPKKDKEDD